MSAGSNSDSQFRTSWYALAPPWLRTGNAERYMYTLQSMSDFLVEKADQATKIRFPGLGDASQLPYLAHDRSLVQGPNEPNDSFVERLKVAFASWKIAGSSLSVIKQMQAYITDLQPGVPGVNPALAIVNGSFPSRTAWWTADVDGSAPVLRAVSPSNWNWDGRADKWRAWLVIYLSPVPIGKSGSAANISAFGGVGGSLLGQNLSGVWSPGTSGTPVNTPSWLVSGLTSLLTAPPGTLWITLSGSSSPGNNGFFPITDNTIGPLAHIANPAGSADAGPITWSVSKYPWIGPSPVWGNNGYVLGQGQSAPPPVTAATIGGVWGPTASAAGYGTNLSLGLNVPSDTIESIRQIVRRWKSAATYYPKIIVAFDGGLGPSNAYSPQSAAGTGNPGGQFGSIGSNASGVWVPNGQIQSRFDCLCQGSGAYYNCSVENVT